MNSQVDKLKRSLLKRPYSYLIVLWFFLFLTLNLFINQVYITGVGILNYTKIVAIPYVSFILLNTFLISININLFIIKFKEISQISPKNSFFSVFGTFMSFLTGACPGCVAGVFPLLMGIFGSNFTLSGLPFYGIELQLFSFILLLVGTYFLSKELTCKIKKNKQ